MRSLLTLFSASLFVPNILAAVVIQRSEGPVVQGSYIVKTKPGGDGPSIQALSSEVDPNSITRYTDVFTGFSGSFSDDQIEKLRHDPNVEAIYEDKVVQASGIVTQIDAPWGLERISHAPKIVQHSNPLSYNYTRDEREGAGVDVFVVDTGININHVQFQGRARLGFSSVSNTAEDDNGHGTHCAGTIASFQFGVAKKANLIAVKVLTSDGKGSTSTVIAGLDYVVAEVKKSGHASVINFSVGGNKDPALDAAVQNVVDQGIHFVVAAGNENRAVSLTSPGTVQNAITVGAIGIDDAKASFSNFGPEIDVHAPGVQVISTYIGSTTATAVASGTSMAAPHVTGLVAYFISLYGNISPQAMGDFVKSKSIKGVITGLPGDTVNNLAFNDVASPLKRRQPAPVAVPRSSWSRRDRFARRKHTA